MIIKLFFLLSITNYCYSFLNKNYINNKFENEKSLLYIEECLNKKLKSPILLDGPTFGKFDYVQYLTKKFNNYLLPISFDHFNEIKFESTINSNEHKLFYIKDFDEKFLHKDDKKLIDFMTNIITEKKQTFILPINSEKNYLNIHHFINNNRNSFLAYYHYVKFYGFSNIEKETLIRTIIKFNKYNCLENMNWDQYINDFKSLNHIDLVLSKTHKFVMSFVDDKKNIEYYDIEKIIEHYIKNQYEI